MKAETAAYLANAAEALEDAKAILGIRIPRQAARLAYYVQFHAAQALIFERTDRGAKTHRGVKIQFHKLTNEDTGLDCSLAGDLAATYHFKEAAGYETGAAAASAFAPRELSAIVRPHE